MILKTISKAIREQNYYAVALEFVIVIAGVVIGFQIQAWNEDRVERAREAAALARIQDDILQNMRELDVRIRFDEDRLANHALMVQAVTSGQLSLDDAASVERAFARILFFSRPPVSQPSYDALEQSGDLALIRDESLMTHLNELRSDLEWIESQQESFRSGLSQFAPIWRPYVFHMPTEDPRQTTVQIDLAGLNTDRQAVSAVVEAARMHAIFANYLVVYASRLLEACTRLAGLTGTPCQLEGAAP